MRNFLELGMFNKLFSCARAFLLLVCFSPVVTHAQVIVIGIAGGTGSGKATLAKQLKNAFGDDITIISQDSYYKELGHLSVEERALVNFDHPNPLDFGLLREHLLKLKQFSAVNIPVYDFKTHMRSVEVTAVEPKHVIIVEGILLFAAPEVKDLFDVRIFVDTDNHIRLLRRIDRDMRERARSFGSIHAQYLATVKPMHDLFVEPSKQYAQLIIPGAHNNAVAVETLVAKIRADLALAAEIEPGC